MLAQIWSTVLGRVVVSAEEDFFALGGHSLLATQVLSRLRGGFTTTLEARLFGRRFFGVRILRFERAFAAIIPVTLRRRQNGRPGRRSHGRFSALPVRRTTASRPDA